ncbi:MAG TPA: hypothetical protein DCZ69_16030 [Syntrophobacteraceae bacterium]|nr:hypothetical protein [Syntrophobacteraceae bacterium]HBD09761.1 hypothetical protein [Syntrophobacteraceae bacterium]HBZ55144.1 hypothetical protein [Syntrophobacteraceae bacterium]
MHAGTFFQQGGIDPGREHDFVKPSRAGDWWQHNHDIIEPRALTTSSPGGIALGRTTGCLLSFNKAQPAE